MKKFILITAIAVATVSMTAIFYACQKDNLVSENTKSGITTKSQEDISVGQLHNDILDAYLQALEENPAVDYIDFSANYLNIDKDQLNIFIEGLSEELSKYSSMDEWFDNLEEKGVFSSECLDAMRKIIEFAANEDLNVEYVIDFKNNIFASYEFHDEKEVELITETLSILEYSIQYWADDDKAHRWEIFRHDPINPDDEPTEGCGSFSGLMGGLYGMYSANFGFWMLNSSLFDLVAYASAGMYATCVNAEYGGDNLTSLGIPNVKQFCSDVSARASSW